VTPDEFVDELWADVVDGYVRYQVGNLVRSTPSAEMHDDLRQMVQLVQALSPDQQTLLASIVRRVAIDVGSNILGIVDGVTSFGQGHEFLLTDEDGTELSGDLQDFWTAHDDPH